MEKLKNWLSTILSREDFTLTSLQGDASFRRYFRLHLDNISYIAVDSPPQTEDNLGFVKVSQAFGDLKLSAPQVLHHDLDQGLLLITDLGDNVFLNHINAHNADELYNKALIELAKIQACKLNLAVFDKLFIQKELNNFREWYLIKHLKINLSHKEEQLLNQAFNILLDSAVSQPQCFIHRDYHSRNLMILSDNNIGILDFQDALIGPITYDLVSLLRDCYINWPADQVEKWALNYYNNYLKLLIPSEAEFIKYFDFMGIQRHLKASFIFARKFHRDGVDNYLKDIPRTLNYVRTISAKYPELKSFLEFINQCPD